MLNVPKIDVKMAQCSEPIEPQYTTDEKSDLATLRVSCYIPSLTVSRKFTAKKLIPKIVKQAENAEIKANFQEDCFSVTVTGNTPSVFKGKVYELKIRKLPKLIIPAESSYQVKEDRVVILLRKRVVESWYPELEEGLDAYEEPSDEEGNIEKKQIEETPKDKIKCETVAEKTEETEKG